MHRYDIDPRAMHPMFQLNSVSQSCHLYRNLMSFATMNCELDLVQYFQEQYYMTIPLHEIQRMLDIATQYGYLDIIKYITEKLKYNITNTNNFGLTNLIYAISCDNLEIVKYLVDVCELNPLTINPNTTRDDVYYNAFFITTENKDTNIIDYFLNEKKIDPFVEHVNLISNAVDYQLFILIEKGRAMNHNIFTLACFRGNLSLVKYLTTRYPNLVYTITDYISNYILLPKTNSQIILGLFYALEQGHMDVAEYLIQYDVHVRILSKDRNDIKTVCIYLINHMFYCIQSEKLELLKKFLRNTNFSSSYEKRSLH